MAKSKIDEELGKITESEIKGLHALVKPKREHNPLRLFKILTIATAMLIAVFVFIFWKFNVVDYPTFSQYKGASKVHLLSFCDIEKFRCKTSKLENGSITLNIKNNFNEFVSIKEVSFGNCTTKYDITLDFEDKVQILVSCEDYKYMKLVYQRGGGITHESEGRVFYFLDLTGIFRIFYKD